MLESGSAFTISLRTYEKKATVKTCIFHARVNGPGKLSWHKSCCWHEYQAVPTDFMRIGAPACKKLSSQLFFRMHQHRERSGSGREGVGLPYGRPERV